MGIIKCVTLLNMFNNTNYKQLSLIVILDAYVTKNAIIDFLAIDNGQIEFRNTLIQNNSKNISKIDNYIKYLEQELEEIEEFLNDKDNIHWQMLGRNREFFDKSLPPHKRKIEWFRSVDRYPFDYSVFFNNISETMYG